MGILSRSEKLAPALRNNRPLDDLAFVGLKELQADLAALLTVWMGLVMGVCLFDFVRLFYFLVGSSRRRVAAHCQNA